MTMCEALPTWIIDYLKIFLFKKIYIANVVRKGLDYRLPTWIIDYLLVFSTNEIDFLT